MKTMLIPLMFSALAISYYLFKARPAAIKSRIRRPRMAERSERRRPL
jgi:hypothetical protein